MRALILRLKDWRRERRIARLEADLQELEQIAAFVAEQRVLARRLLAEELRRAGREGVQA